MRNTKKNISICITVVLLVTSFSTIISGNNISSDVNNLYIGNDSSLLTLEYTINTPQIEDVELFGNIFSRVRISDEFETDRNH